MLNSQTDATALVSVLARLRRKGARLDPDGAAYRIVYPGERRRLAGGGRGEPSRLVCAGLVAMGQKLGWLITTAAQPGSLHLTEAGALAAHRGANPDSKAPRVVPSHLPTTAPPTERATRARASLSPLARLRQMRDRNGAALLSSAQVEAGERLANDFLKGQMMPRVTANWDRAALGFGTEPRGSSGVANVSDGAASAQQHVRRALAAAGPAFADLLIDVCCLEIGLEVVEKRRGWVAGTGRVVLAFGLDTLLQHYGIVASGPKEGRTTHWGEAGYRPVSSVHGNDHDASAQAMK